MLSLKFLRSLWTVTGTWSLIEKQPLKVLGRMHCMLMDLLHGFEVLSTTEETLFNSRNVSRSGAK